MLKKSQNFILIILTLAQLFSPSVQYSKVARIVAKPIKSEELNQPREFPFHFQNGDSSSSDTKNPFKLEEKGESQLNSFNIGLLTKLNDNPPLNKKALKLGEDLGTKLVNFVVDHIPTNFVGPIKTFVGVGRKLLENWEGQGGQGSGRQGGSLSEMLDYGWDQVSKWRESYQNLWPPSNQLAHRHESSHGESQEGGLDTFALLAALAFAAYLLQLLVTLTATTSRALDRSSNWFPSLLTSDLDSVPEFVQNLDGNDQRVKRDLNFKVEPLKSIERRLANGEKLNCESIKKELKWTGRVEFIIKNLKCPPT